MTAERVLTGFFIGIQEEPLPYRDIPERYSVLDALMEYEDEWEDGDLLDVVHGAWDPSTDPDDEYADNERAFGAIWNEWEFAITRDDHDCPTFKLLKGDESLILFPRESLLKVRKR